MKYRAIYATFLLVAAGISCAPEARGQGAVDPLVRGKQIVDDAIAALGGDKFLTVQNRIETGRAYSFAFGDLSGASPARFYTRYVEVASNETATKVAEQQHQGLGKEEAFYRLYRDEGAWEVTFRGPKKMEPEQADRYRDSTLHNVFYILRVRRNEPEMLFDYQGTDVIDNTPVNVVDIVDSTNRKVRVFFHPTTKLPVRQDWSWRDPQTHERNDEVTRFGRYREVGGVQWPFQVNRERNDRKVYEMFAESVEFNRDIDPARFAIPTDKSRPFQSKKR